MKKRGSFSLWRKQNKKERADKEEQDKRGKVGWFLDPPSLAHCRNNGEMIRGVLVWVRYKSGGQCSVGFKA